MSAPDDASVAADDAGVADVVSLGAAEGVGSALATADALGSLLGAADALALAKADALALADALAAVFPCFPFFFGLALASSPVVAIHTTAAPAKACKRRKRCARRMLAKVTFEPASE